MSSPKRTAVKERQTKAQIVSAISEETGLTNKQVKAVLSALAGQAERHLKARAVGEFVVPELGIKMKTVKKKATKARPGRNPFTGEEIMIKAKPASTSVRAVALKAAKDFASA
jgi:nucleoid DNA-binding protein